MESIVDFLLNFYGPTPYLIIFGVLLACGLGLPIPEDITLFTAGLLSYYGLTDIYGTIVLCFAGVMIGDSVIFILGRYYGRRLTQRWFFKKLFPEQRMTAVQEKFHQRGNSLIFAARFMPGLRAPIFFSAGTLHLPFSVFLFYDGFAALVSVPLIVGAVYYFGDDIDWIVKIIQHVEHSIVLVIFLVLFAIVGKWYITHRRLKRS